jgi:hypothetical protein
LYILKGVHLSSSTSFLFFWVAMNHFDSPITKTKNPEIFEGSQKKKKSIGRWSAPLFTRFIRV